MQLFVAPAQRSSALLQGAPLGQQRPLVDDGADEVRQLVFAVVNACDVQVARKNTRRTGQEYHLARLAGAVRLGQRERFGDLLRMAWADQRQQKCQGQIFFERAQQPQCHGIAFQHHALFVHHHQGQRNTGKKREKALGGTLRRALAVTQRLVLDFQLGLVLAQILDHLRQAIALRNYFGQSAVAFNQRRYVAKQLTGLAARGHLLVPPATSSVCRALVPPW